MIISASHIAHVTSNHYLQWVLLTHQVPWIVLRHRQRSAIALWTSSLMHKVDRRKDQSKPALIVRQAKRRKKSRSPASSTLASLQNIRITLLSTNISPIYSMSPNASRISH